MAWGGLAATKRRPRSLSDKKTRNWTDYCYSIQNQATGTALEQKCFWLLGDLLLEGLVVYLGVAPESGWACSQKRVFLECRREHV